MRVQDATVKWPWDRLQRGGRLEPVFQPIVELNTGSIVGYEVLSRAFDAQSAPISLEDLFAAAASDGLLRSLDLMMLHRCLQGIQLQHVSGMRYFVNLLPETLEWDETAVLIAQFMTDTSHSIPLVLEVSERTADPYARAWDVILAPYRELGCEIAMDDVGSGYAGLNRTVEMNPTWLKMDIGLIRGIEASPRKAAMVASVVTFTDRLTAHAIVAEGIETAEEYATLLGLGVRFGQGFYFSKPTSVPTLCPSWALPLAMVPQVVNVGKYALLVSEYLQRLCLTQQHATLIADVERCIREMTNAEHVKVYRIREGRVDPTQANEAAGVEWAAEMGAPYMTVPSGYSQVLSGHEIFTLDHIALPIGSARQVHGILLCQFACSHRMGPETLTIIRGFTAVLALAFSETTCGART